MEVRSSRRMRTLVTRMALRGLSANELARALISMMARSTTCSNQRPDTLMQDRSPPARRNPLATDGRTIDRIICGQIITDNNSSIVRIGAIVTAALQKE